MAKPKYHIIATIFIFAAIMILKMMLNIPENIENAIAILFILGLFGVLVDIDHIYSSEWIKKFLSGQKVIPPERWVNKFHTWQILIVIILLSLVLKNYLPITAYAAHMLIDGANRINTGSPLPEDLNKIFPRFLTYEYWEK